MLYLNTDFGQNFLDGFKVAIKGTKMQLVAAQSNANTDPTVDTQLTNLKASGADTLIVATAGKAAAQAIRFAAESRLEADAVRHLCGLLGASRSRPAGLENSKGVLTGQFVKPVGSPAFDNDPGVKQYVADYERFKPRFDRHDSLAQMGYLMADGVVKVLEQMKTPTREAMMEAVRNMNKVELGLLYPGITMTPRPARTTSRSRRCSSSSSTARATSRSARSSSTKAAPRNSDRQKPDGATAALPPSASQDRPMPLPQTNYHPPFNISARATSCSPHRISRPARRWPTPR